MVRRAKLSDMDRLKELPDVVHTSLVPRIHHGAGELTFKGAKIVYGLSIKLGGDGAVIDKFGNIGEGERGPVVRAEREPMVELLDELRQLRVIAELPGVSEEDISVDVGERKVTIKAETSGRRYHKDVPLPCRVRMVRSSYRNGVLEVVLEKVDQGTS